MSIKVITLHQPWAQWLVMGVKVYETRGWSTYHRGLIAIHAGRTWNKDVEAFTANMCAKYPQLRPKDDLFPLGAVVGACLLTAVYDAGKLSLKLGRMESELGNFAEGRYAWRMENPEIYPAPVWVSGKQGIWNWDGRGAGEASFGKV
jgi:hypothetical protein